MYVLVPKFHFFRVSITIEPGRCLLQFVNTTCLIVGQETLLVDFFLITGKKNVGYLRKR